MSSERRSRLAASRATHQTVEWPSSGLSMAPLPRHSAARGLHSPIPLYEMVVRQASPVVNSTRNDPERVARFRSAGGAGEMREKRERPLTRATRISPRP
jgi:hypothetical protein